MNNFCERCNKRLMFSQRMSGHRWCMRCAAIVGVEQIGAPTAIKERSMASPPWWRWTHFLAFAVFYDLPVDNSGIRRVVIDGKVEV